MTAAAAAHLRTSTLISVVISMAISAAFFLLVFGRTPQIALLGSDGLAPDFIPQTLAAGFMAALVPALQTRAKIIAGTLAGSVSSPGAICARAAMLAVAALGLPLRSSRCCGWDRCRRCPGAQRSASKSLMVGFWA